MLRALSLNWYDVPTDTPVMLKYSNRLSVGSPISETNAVPFHFSRLYERMGSPPVCALIVIGCQTTSISEAVVRLPRVGAFMAIGVVSNAAPLVFRGENPPYP